MIEHEMSRPLELDEVDLTNGFWCERQRLAKEKMIPYQWRILNDEIEGAPKSHAVDNLRIAAGRKTGTFYGRVFQDSDVAKWLEAVAYAVHRKPDPDLERIADEVIELIGEAQQEDGYLHTYTSLVEPDMRWTNLRDNHELYCAGHMIEAAVAYFEATGKTKFLEIVERLVDHIDNEFGPEPTKRQGYPGHQEIELALIRLYRVTNQEKYLRLAQYFLDQRGQEPPYFVEEAKKRPKDNPYLRKNKERHGLPYSQSHKPIRMQTEAIGHAVRAMYMYTAMAELALETGEDALQDVLERLWDDVIRSKLYITGGIGSSEGNGEAITFAYDLPNDRAYAETCATIGLVFWAHKMLLLTSDSKYSDVMELALYNGFLSGVSLDGTKYFYVNPLEVWPEACAVRTDLAHVKSERQAWFDTACCPTNVARLLTSFGRYIYSHSQDTLYIHLYTPSKAVVQLNSHEIELTQETGYPWKEDVELSIGKGGEFTLALRVPGWCRQPTVWLNDEELNCESLVEKGYVKISRFWSVNDRVRLHLPMPVEIVKSNPQLRYCAGKAALQRGPIVYCFEEVDNGENLSALIISKDSAFRAEYADDVLGGVVVLKGKAIREEASNENHLYYRDNHQQKVVEVTAVPYFTWCNREPGEMLVWMRFAEPCNG